MISTLLVAKILGVYFIVSGIFVATHQKTFGVLMKDFFGHRALLFIVGAIMVMGGALIIFTSGGGYGWLPWFVKVMGWAILIKGALYILSPDSLHRMVRKWKSSTLTLMGATIAAIGIYLVFFLF